MTSLLAAVFAAAALFSAIALVMLVVSGRATAADTRLAEMAQAGDERAGQGLGDMFWLLTRPLRPFRDWLRANDKQLAGRLALAGYRRPAAVDTFLTAKLLVPIAGVVAATFTGHDNIILCAILFGAAGFFAPDLFLIWAVNRRKTKLSLALPDAMDLLVICMEAGLGIDQAVLRVGKEMEIVEPELSDELLTIGREQRAGMPRTEAWRSMADRVDVDVARQFVAMLVQTEKLGTPIARALGLFADNLRTKRLLEAEEQAAKTTVKLVFPLVLFIFPALFVVLLGPAAITLMQGLASTP